jgi:hypothetical protein
MADNVHHPEHYGGEANPHECIKCLKAWLSDEEYRGFLLGNTLKYLSRLGKKGDALEDACKAAVYLKWLIEQLEEERG